MEKEFGEKASSKGGVDKWARIRLNNSERDVQRVVRDQETKLKVPVTTIVADGVTIPWISPIDWLQFLVDNGLWHHLAGLGQDDKRLAPQVWNQFWDMHKQLCPHFSLYDDETLAAVGDLGCVAGVYLHGDEGRTLKRNGLMVVAIQSILGFGFGKGRAKHKRDGTLQLQCNYTGHTFTNRFVMGVIPKVWYESQPTVFNEAMGILSRQLQTLFLEGVLCKRTKRRYRLCLLGCKGDWPFLQKVGGLNRAFNTGVKRGTRNKKPPGTCHLCLSGFNDEFPGEEIDTNKPEWLQTIGTLVPWRQTPLLLRYICHDKSHPASFFVVDGWHTFHLGIGKSFVSSTIQLCLPFLDGNLEQKFQYLTNSYRQFCQARKYQYHIGRITGYLVSYGDQRGASGTWSKGALTSNLMRWLPTLISGMRQDAGGVLEKCANAAKSANLMFHYLFELPLFLSEHEAIYIASLGATFLRIYGELAQLAFRRGNPLLYPMIPKLHSFHHLVVELEMSAKRCGFAQSPMATACQQDEDLVGRCSRLRCRVSARLTMLRTMERYLIQCHTAWAAAGILTKD